MTKKGKILVVDDNRGIREALRILLGGCFAETQMLPSPVSLIRTVEVFSPDVVLLDMNFTSDINTGGEGLYWLGELKSRWADLPVVLFTAYADISLAVEGMKRGAADFVVKPWDNARLLGLLTEVRDRRKTSAKSSSSEEDTQGARMFWGESPAMQTLRSNVQKIAATDASVLITGENGTGKDVLANEIHRLSRRSGRRMVCVDAGAVTETLFESEMFGHVKGSFTGAVSDKEGLFEAANGGTLFLDEISSMPLILQGKFLRALQEHEIRRVGDTKSIPVDVRIIAASNANLEEAVVKGTFRSDLFYRLAVIMIDIPPLRERPEDILPLARHFIAEEVGKAKNAPVIGDEAARLLLAYDWPGNVRELENCMRHALTFAGSGEIQPKDLPARVAEHKGAAAAGHVAPSAAKAVDAANNSSLKSFLRQKEREYIGEILNAEGGDKEKAAERLKVNLSTLYRKLSEE